MQVSFTGRHVEVTDALKRYAEEKLQHLRHSFDQVVDAHVVFSVEKFRQIADLQIQANGMNIHAREETEDMYASIDGVVDKLNRQLKRYRAKMHRHQNQHNQRKGREIKVGMSVVHAHPEHHDEIPADLSPSVVHHDHVQAKPMSVDEALMQLDLGKENFFVFTNQETEKVNVLCRRQDGSFSWIEPDQA